MTLYSTLKERSECPVVELGLPFYLAGRYVHPDILGSRGGKECIRIEKDMHLFEKTGTLAHEMGHKRCHNRRCRCYKTRDWVSCEVHAELYALHLLFRKCCWYGIRARLKRLRDNWYANEYIEARNVIYERKIYKRCQEALQKVYGRKYE